MGSREKRIAAGVAGFFVLMLLVAADAEVVGGLLAADGFGVVALVILRFIRPAWLLLAVGFIAVGMAVNPLEETVPRRARQQSQSLPAQPAQTPAQRGEVAALVRCPDQMERFARYASRWTDGLLGPKLSRSRPTANPNVVT